MNQKLRTVLIVDDSPDDRQLYQHYLLGDRDYAYTFIEAGLGQQGVELWQQHQPDVVLLDYCLPDLDGLAFLAQVQSFAPQGCLPIVVVTGQGNEAIAVRMMKAGAQDYLVKGQISTEMLQLAVNEAIEVVQLRTQLQQQLQQQQLIAHIAQHIRQSLDLDTILQATVDEVRQFLRTDRVFIYRFQSDFAGVVAVESVGENWPPILNAQVKDTYFVETQGQDYRQGRIHAVDDIYAAGLTDCHIELLERFQVRANLAVPILHGETLWGLLMANHCSAPHKWTPLEIDLLRQLTTQLGIALQQAELDQQLRSELTERQRTEAALRESQALFEAFMRYSPATAYIKDEEGRYLYINPLNEQIYDRPIQDWLGKTDAELFPPEEAQQRRDHDLTALALGQAIEVTATYQQVGEARHFLSYKFPIHPSPDRRLVAGLSLDISDRKRAEERLRESEEHLRYTVELNPQVPWTADSEGRITGFSDRWLNLTGLTREQALGEGWTQVPHPDDAPAMVAAWTHSISTGEPYDVEHRIQLANGSYRWMRSRAFPRRNPKGEIVCWYGTTEDIDDRKQSEEALRVSEAQFRTIANAAPVLVWVCAANGEVVFMNERWYEYTGQTVAEAQGLGWTETVHPDDAIRILPLWERCQKTGEPYEGEIRYRQKHGEYRWYRFRALPQRNHQGAIEKWFGCSVDIHDAKLAEQDITINEARLRGFFEANAVGMLYGDIHGNIAAANDELLRIVGYTRADLQAGRIRWIDITPPEYLPLDAERIAEARQRGACTPYEKEYIRKDGSRIPVLLGYSLVGEAREESVAFILDLSDRKAIEAQREQLLQREQAARAEAERANQVKDEFLAVLSHELRSPLNPILGWTKMMQSHNFSPDKTAEALATIERNVKLQIQLIDDLLDTAKILRGKLVLNVTDVELVFVIEAALDTVQTAATAKSIALNPVLVPVGLVSGDATRLQQIIWNLLSNAVKFTPNNGRVDILLERVGHEAQITVRDTGKGIHPAFLPHLFESFRQEDSSINRRYGGLGLGLSIVRYLVEAHGGSVWAESPGEGQGATFIVRLPLVQSKFVPSQLDPLPDEEIDLTGIRVLVIDDECDSRELLTVMLTQYQADVLAVSTAAAVFAALESYHPAVLISDIGMPDVNGYTLMQQIRMLPAAKGGHIPAIALTAYAREEDRQRALAAGFHTHIAKPLDPYLLMQAIYKLVQDKLVQDKLVQD